MELLDFREVSQTSFTADLCIIGTGPAGLAIAQELASTPYRVLLLESGPAAPSPQSNALDEVENIGAPRQPEQSLVRSRAFGGTSWVWNGRCTPLDPSDLQERSWVPLSGWPLSYEQLSPYLARAAAQLGLCAVTYDAELDSKLPEPGRDPALWSHAVQSCRWQYSVDSADTSVAMRCAQLFRGTDPPNIRVLLHATATQLEPNSDGTQMASVEVRSLTGKRAKVYASLCVVCAGGIETPRLLLASRQVIPCGLGNQHDRVGRHLMDHARCSLGRFALPQAERLRPAYSLQRIDVDGRARYFLRGLALSPECQQREQLLSCAGWLRGTEAADDPWNALKRVRQRGFNSALTDWVAIARQPHRAARELYRKLAQGQPARQKLSKLELVCDVEQAPDPASRITLSETLDPLGVPRARIDWRISALERRTLRRFAEHCTQAFLQGGLPAPHLRDSVLAEQFEPPDLIDVAHPSGTTRMASDPQRGVVDAHCRVHGMKGLYIASTSVFPTQGHANPTLTLVALAIRLADRLKAHDFARVAPAVGQPDAAPITTAQTS